MTAPDSLVVLLHGVGATGSDLAPLGTVWNAALPRTVFVSPDAPEPFDGGRRLRQWFSLTDVTAENRPARVAAGRAGFDRLLEQILGRYGFADRLHRVALVGFSQGSTVALDVVASGRWPVAAVVGLSGRLATPPPLDPSTNTPVLLVHGAGDPVVPVAETFQAAATLRGLGVEVTSEVLPGVGHEIAARAAALAGAFLADVLNSDRVASADRV